ncbi:hypothetical protein H5410_002193 [Solanum commersonii]|uniref:Uncharacterized protein n=1 Tax=Solanum commersonii TaxID=4109 RepID=A0A9J6B1D4_SOLCO|nr:hypothetical protein H5410_002193 [Solanum commersonii]
MGGKRPKHDDLGEFQPENDGVDSSPFEGSIENDRKLDLVAISVSFNMQGKKKTIIIVPEWSFNSGWLDIATKITNFINVKTTRTVKLLHQHAGGRAPLRRGLSRIINGQPER